MSGPNQHDFASQSGKTTYGVVCDINDPDKRGRCRVLLFDGQYDKVSLSKLKLEDLPWIKVVASPHSPQLRGLGTFPHGLMVGTKVAVQWDGQQNPVIVAVHYNNDKDETVQDAPKTTTPTFMQVVNALTQQNSRNPVIKQMFGGKMPYEYKGIKDAIGFLNGTIRTPTSPYEGDPLKAIVKFAPQPSPKTGRGSDSYWDRDGRTPQTLGPYLPEIDKTVIDKIKADLGTAGELIPGALSMAEKLVATAKAGVNLDAFTMRGGTSVVTTAISAITTLISAFNDTAKHKADEAAALEEILRLIYKAETGKDALDADGNETYAYKQWRTARLAAAGVTS